VFHTLQQDSRAFLQLYKSKSIPAIVEQVKDASNFKLLLILNENGNSIYQYINCQLSGVNAPVFRKDIPNVQDLVEPFGEEAKYFVESRLLQKNVHVRLESVSGHGNGISFFGTIIHPAGNISEILLAEG
jgi:staphylococcal nuclease domain-containing protein 1